MPESERLFLEVEHANEDPAQRLIAAYRNATAPGAQDRAAVELDALLRPEARAAARRFFQSEDGRAETAEADTMRKFFIVVALQEAINYPHALLAEIATNCCHDIVRSERRYRETIVLESDRGEYQTEEATGWLDVFPEEAPTPEEEQIVRERADKIHTVLLAFINTLNKEDAMLARWYLADRPFSELAASLGKRSNTLDVRWSRLKRKLIEYLAKRDIHRIEDF